MLQTGTRWMVIGNVCPMEPQIRWSYCFPETSHTRVHISTGPAAAEILSLTPKVLRERGAGDVYSKRLRIPRSFMVKVIGHLVCKVTVN